MKIEPTKGRETDGQTLGGETARLIVLKLELESNCNSKPSLIADAPEGDAREEGYLVENENLTHPHIFASGQGNSTENLP